MSAQNREAARNKEPEMKKKNLAEKVEENEFDEDGSYPIYGDKPFFHLFMKKSALTHAFRMIFPHRMHRLLPSKTIEATLTFRGKDEKIVFHGKRQQKAFGAGWRKFVRAQKLRVGDAIVFEVMESNDRCLHFKIQILRCPTPPAQDEVETRRARPSSPEEEESDDLDEDDDDYDVHVDDDE